MEIVAGANALQQC